MWASGTAPRDGAARRLECAGDGRTFTVRDADPQHWALLACWSDPRAVEAFPIEGVVLRLVDLIPRQFLREEVAHAAPK
jgi:hypothetical protein